MEKQDEFSELFKDIHEWHATTPDESRTVDNLLQYLTKKKFIFLFKKPKKSSKEDGAVVEKMNVQFLAAYLLSKKLEFKLTPSVVDAFLAPTFMYKGIEEYSYQFFLEHFHEHPMLVKKILKGLNKPLRLRVQPVLPADDNLMTWFFDPWETKVYTLSANWGEPLLKRPDEEVMSVSTFSVFAEYKGKEHPFSEAYQERVRQYREFQNALNSA